MSLVGVLADMDRLDRWALDMSDRTLDLCDGIEALGDWLVDKLTPSEPRQLVQGADPLFDPAHWLNRTITVTIMAVIAAAWASLAIYEIWL